MKQSYIKSIGKSFADRRTGMIFLALIVVSLVLIYVRFALIAAVDHDEAEHAHVAFRMLHHELPYRDFYQNHLPAYWLLSKSLIHSFPFSVHAILAARCASLLALTGCWLLGLRLLGSVRGGRTWPGFAIYTWAVIALAYQTDFHEARPDPVMVLFATAGLCMIPMRGGISNGRALMSGVLLGLSAAVSAKVLPMILIVPALVAVACIRNRCFRAAAVLFPYGLGLVSGLLPTALWIFHNGLFDAFCFDVFGLNRALSKPLYDSLKLLLRPLYVASILGALVQLGTCKRRGEGVMNGVMTLVLTLGAGGVLALLARHPGAYNLQILVIPMAVGFSGFILCLCLCMRGLRCRLLLCAALLGYLSIYVAKPMLIPRLTSGLISQYELQQIMDLAKPGNRTCIGFAPNHPIFCHDISGLSNGWDLTFSERITDPRQLDRFHKLWQEGIQRTLDLHPDIIVRKSPENIWERAVKAGLIKPGELRAIDSLRSAYRVIRIGNREVWVRDRI